MVRVSRRCPVGNRINAATAAGLTLATERGPQETLLRPFSILPNGVQGGVAYIPHRRGFRKGKDSKDRTMRNGWFISGMLLWGMLLGAAPAQSREPVAVRVMTYNIQYGNGASLEIAALIREQNPDFVALQEVDCKTCREYVSARQHGRDFSHRAGTAHPACSRFTARRFRLPEGFLRHRHPELTALYPHGKDHASQSRRE